MLKEGTNMLSIFVTLNSFTHTLLQVPNLQPADLVLREENTTPLHWPTAVIIDVHPGKDGIVRVVTLRTPRGTFKRPITKICPLPRE